MSIAIKINEEIYNAAKPVARAQYRSVPNQIAYWAKIGHTAIDNPDLPIEFIIGILESLGEPSEPFEFTKPHEKHNN